MALALGFHHRTLPLLIYQLSRGESLQPAALQAPFAARWKNLGAGSNEAEVDERTGGCYGSFGCC